MTRKRLQAAETIIGSDVSKQDIVTARGAIDVAFNIPSPEKMKTAIEEQRLKTEGIATKMCVETNAKIREGISILSKALFNAVKKRMQDELTNPNGDPSEDKKGRLVLKFVVAMPSPWWLTNPRDTAEAAEKLFLGTTDEWDITLSYIKKEPFISNFEVDEFDCIVKSKKSLRVNPSKENRLFSKSQTAPQRFASFLQRLPQVVNS